MESSSSSSSMEIISKKMVIIVVIHRRSHIDCAVRRVCLSAAGLPFSNCSRFGKSNTAPLLLPIHKEPDYTDVNVAATASSPSTPTPTTPARTNGYSSRIPPILSYNLLQHTPCYTPKIHPWLYLSYYWNCL